MKLNIPFETDENKSWYALENAARDGVWPLSYNGVWHTGIHFKAKQQYSLLRPFIPGEIVASRFCDEYGTCPINSSKYSSSFVLMRHYFGSKKIPFYILYSGLGSKKAVEENEFIAYKNANGKTIYRPLFCREWKLKSDSVDIINNNESHLPAIYENNTIKGYINRDGSYVLVKAPNNKVFLTTSKNKYYTVLCDTTNNNPIGFYSASERGKYFSRKNETTDNETVDGKSGIWVTLYYDNSCLEGYEKVKINIKDIARIEKLAEGEKYIIDSMSTNNRKNLYFEDEFHIITEEEIKKGTQVVKKNDFLKNKDEKDVKIINYRVEKIGTYKAGTPQKEFYNNVANDRKCRCFEGDKLTITAVDSYNGKFQYKVKKESVSAIIDGSKHDGYIKTSNYHFTTLYSYKYRNNSVKSNANLPTHNNLIRICDDPFDENVGFTVYPSSCLDNNIIYEILEKNPNEYYALVKINKISSPMYYTPALINENNDSYFYGYVKLNKDYKSCINSTFKDKYPNSNNVILGKPADVPDEYIGPIGIFDTNYNQQEDSDNDIENDLELHVELFTASLDDFNFTKKRKKLNNSEVDEVFEITNTDDIKKANNECTLEDAKNKNFNINNLNANKIDFNKNIINYYCNSTQGLATLHIKVYEKIFFTKKNKKEIDVNSKTIKVKFSENDEKKILKIQVIKKLKMGEISIERNEFFDCFYDDNVKSYYFLYEKNDFKTGYSILSNIIGKSSKDTPVSLPDDTVLFEGDKITLTTLSDNEKIPIREKLIAFYNVQFVKIDGIDYFRAKISNNFYYIPEKKLDKAKCEKNYEKVEEGPNNTIKSVESSKRYNVFDFPGFILFDDPEDDYICDLSEIAEKTGLQIGCENQNIADLVYGNDNATSENDGETLYKQLTRLIIKAPSMWEEPEGGWDNKKSEYVKNVGYWGIPDDNNSLNNLYKYIKDQFFIDSNTKDTIFNKEPSKPYKYYYFHPLKFLEYYSKKTRHEINPYCGEVLIDKPFDGTDSSMGGVNIVMNNPGFAPYVKNSDYGNYPNSNGLFNENYLPVSNFYVKNYYSFHHEGIDIPAGKGAEIKSFIYGEIITWGWRKSYGRSTYILDREKQVLYLLAHQHKYMDGIKKGLKIAPGDTVGYVGGSGTNGEKDYGYHLHITKYILKNSEFNENWITGQSFNDPNTSLKVPKINLSDQNKNKLSALRVNPLMDTATRSDNV